MVIEPLTPVTRVSVLTGVERTRVINVDPDKLEFWEKNRMSCPYIQNMFPELSDDDKEFILSGVTPEEWEELFGDE